MSSSIVGTPLFIANNLALDFINTEYGEGDRHCDCFEDNRSVVEWLELAGVLFGDCSNAPSGLAELARELRENARALVVAARTGRVVAPTTVNRVLASGRPREALEWDPADRSFKIVKHWQSMDAMSLLEPVAQALANLLSNEDLQLVRECEAHDCTLFFHDLTKSHRRRWCSMASCGNRMKAAAHRARKYAK